MNIMQTVIDAAKQYSPKHAVKFENAIRESRSNDIPVLANVLIMVCAEHGVNPDIPNPFPHGTDEHADWAGWCDSATVEDAPAEPNQWPHTADQFKAEAKRVERNRRAREKRAAKPKPKPKQAKKAPAKKKA